MSKVKILPENLANKIAAGEVIERPASVVKELAENAIDAKSRRVFISLGGGGVGFIQVQDDGEGMDPSDALLAFQRHATSKLSGERDLTSIGTLGFRGEALPSIASVSKIRLITQTPGAEVGTEIRLEGGAVRNIRSIGAPHGSLFEVNDLFFNTPARKKFLKSRQTELGHIHDVVFTLALSHPEIHFRLSHGERVLLDTPPVVHPRDRLLQLFGEAVIDRCIESQEEISARDQAASLSLHAFFSRPPLQGNNRKDQYLFVNRRPVKNAPLSHAVHEAYASYVMKGEHPFFILFLEVDPEQVDVNVHPTKKEIRFQNADSVYRSVHGLIRNALSSAGWPSLPKSFPNLPGSSLNAEGRLLEKEFGIVREGAGSYLVPGASPEKGPGFPSDASGGTLPLIRPLGQVYGTFLVAEIDGEFTIIDQHTAHERILYETFLEQLGDPGVPTTGKGSPPGVEIQPLLIPQQVDLPPVEAALLKDQLKNLEEIGWKIELFGENTFLIREVPAMIAGIHFESLLLDLAQELAQVDFSSKTEQPILKIIASMACHGAVRAHQSLSLPEIEALLRKYFERKTPPTCPHGRPIVVTYPLLELEKLFRRK